jgi:hypothetical protein
MNGAFKAVSEALWLNGDIGGKETRRSWEKLGMLALLVMIAVSMALGWMRYFSSSTLKERSGLRF